MLTFLEPGLVLLGSTTMLLGVFFVSKQTAFALAYVPSSRYTRRYWQERDHTRHRLWTDVREAMLGSNGV